MNASQIVNMIMRTVMRKLINKGVDAGIDRVSRRGKRPEDMTPEERQRAKATKGQARGAQKMLRMGRRLTRM